MILFFFITLLWRESGGGVFAQRKNNDTLNEQIPISNFREKIFSLVKDTFRIDTISIIPSSVIIEAGGIIISNADYEIDEANSILIWKKKPAADNLKISYRVFPYNFSQTFFHKDFRKIRKDSSSIYNSFIYSPDETAGSLFEFGGLNYNGSISRGISFGNSQDLVVNSAFNLQMSGNLSKDVEVNAAITDENVPLQPDGNTQQLQEFDKVFIQFKKGNNTLIAGDYEIYKPESHFMNFMKKSQGLSFKSSYKVKEKNNFQTQLSLAVAKGKYSKNVLENKEGNQGPYKLMGANGETFIIILAGTERVFIDGLKLERGADRDYIIDYNTGEITFTPKRLITKDLRIVVEFEYSDKNYFRSLMYFNQEYEREKMKVKFNFYSEQDSKNQPLDQDLSPVEKSVLERIGDNIDSAVVSGVDTMDFDAARVMYKKIDTVVYTNQSYAVFTYSANSDSARFVLSFSYVGLGNGNYKIDEGNTVNGRVYKWVAPDSATGRKSGDYEPVIKLIPPKQQQLYTLGIDYKFNKNNLLKTEFALSNYDVNTFSSKDNNDNAGVAGIIIYKNKIPLSKTNPDDLTFNTDVNYEFINKLYQPIERNRTVEFERDWNLSGISAKNDEHNGNISFNLVKNKLGNLQYGFSTFLKGSDYEGYQHSWNSLMDKNGFRIGLNGSFLQTKTLTNQTKFFRPKAEFSKSFRKLRGWKIGVRGEQENNRFSPMGADSLMLQSFLYNQYQVFTANADTAKVRWNSDFTQRVDYTPLNNSFEKSSLANTLNFGGAMTKNPNSQLQWTATYRELNIIDSAKANGKKYDEAILGRIEYSFALWKGMIRSNSLYEIGSGREQKRSYRFIQTQQEGTGTHKSLGDADSNGVVDIYEYVVAPFQSDANYIKVFDLTNEYINTYSTQFNQLLDISPKAIWYDAEGFKKFVSRFSTQSALQINRKIINSPDAVPYNPFELNVEDTVLVSVNSNIRNSVYFNRTNSKYGIDFDWMENRDKAFLTGGFESRQFSEKSLKSRLNISKKITASLMLKQGNKINSSGASVTGSYDVGFSEIEPKITFQPSSSFRISFFYNYAENHNSELLGGEDGYNSKYSTEIKYNVLSKSTLNARASFAQVTYRSSANTPVAFAILQGLQNGNNALWSIAYERTLASNIQISFIYDGRKTGESKVVHTGRAQVRAVF